MKNMLLVMFGGALGTGLRYGANIFGLKLFPEMNAAWLTLGINFFGSFLMGLFLAKSSNYSAETLMILTIGLCGGFTTFSAFSKDVFLMLNQGEVLSAILLILASILLGVFGFYGGYAMVTK